MITVVHCKREPDSEYIGRPSPLGNPYPLKKGAPKGSTLPRYRQWLQERVQERDPAVCSELNRLYKIAKHGDLKLGCWCAPGPCHGDVIKELLESKLKERT